MNWNPFTWFKSDEVTMEPEAPEVEPEEETELDPIIEEHKPNGKYREHDARATAAEEELRKTMEEIKNDDFDEKMQSLTIGTQSLSQDQLRSILGKATEK